MDCCLLFVQVSLSLSLSISFILFLSLMKWNKEKALSIVIASEKIHFFGLIFLFFYVKNKSVRDDKKDNFSYEQRIEHKDTNVHM